MPEQHTTQPATPATHPGIHLGAAAWIKPLPCRRGETLCPADKLVLQALWDHADWRLEADAPARRIYPTRETLAEETGLSVRAVRKSLARLGELTWIRRRPVGWDLAWRVPFCARVADSNARERAAPAPQGVGETSAPQIHRPLKGPAIPSDRPLKGSAPAPQGATERIHEPKGIDQLTTQFMSFSQNAPIQDSDREPEPERESPAPPRHPPGMGQLTIDGIEEPDTTPKADPADEVFAHLRARILATKRDLGIKPVRAPKILADADRRRINDRIREYGDGVSSAGVEACKQVIDVDEADSRRAGKISPYWNATTPFRNVNNFENRLLRWREDGEHAAFGVRSGGKSDSSFYPEMDDALWNSVAEGFES